ncbi:hypothetical protein RN001_009020 [Aquatica leii]|uniref:RRM domain-containing protein n=1 Tax=Aquatica leii TaxID=1421715 RepID=A0AAN7PTB9_9COLE|nr:hypothetical protein RN001_009020 [Aquatica leii]
MYRSGKQFMKNPATTASRIYIGNVLDQVTTVDLEDRFKCYGTILGLVLQRGFGFIQFETEAQAQLAIKSEHGALFFGRKLNVKQAFDKGKNTPLMNKVQGPPPRIDQRPPPPKADMWQNSKMESPPPPPITQPPPQIKPKPLMDILITPPKVEPPVEKMEVSIEESKIDNTESGNEPEQQAPSRVSDVGSDSSDRKRSTSGNRRGGGLNRGRQDRDFERFSGDDFTMRDTPVRDVGQRDVPLRDMPPRDLPPRDVRDPGMFYGRDDNFRPPPTYIPPPVIERPERNDCEIIVVSRLLTEYAEYIEQRLKGIGLMVDLLYPNEDVPIGRVLANISSRGCLYAILVMPQNEEYRSLTLSILHGIPQEHRNIPVEDAITLISRNFDAYMRGEKSTSPGAGTSLLDRHPEGIQMILNLLAENRQLTSVQYDRIMKYLQDRRELQRQFEVTEGEGDNDNEVQPNSKQAELQSRIMNILNKSTEDAPKPVEAPQIPATPTPLLNDPSVQKALDSLLSGDMLKSIASGL